MDAQHIASAIASNGLLAAQASQPPINWDEVGSKFAQDALFQARQTTFEAKCPAEYRVFEIDRFNAESRLVANQAAFDRVTAWKPGPRGILAAGPTGGGKTLACWQLVRRLMLEELREVAIYTASEWFSRLQGHVNYGKDEAEGWVKAVAARPIVFIDDWGQEAVVAQREDWARGWFFTFLDLRKSASLPLILTTNLSSREIAFSGGETKGDPLIRRLLAVADPVKFV